MDWVFTLLFLGLAVYFVLRIGIRIVMFMYDFDR